MVRLLIWQIFLAVFHTNRARKMRIKAEIDVTGIRWVLNVEKVFCPSSGEFASKWLSVKNVIHFS